jgi:hypothetical protein
MSCSDCVPLFVPSVIEAPAVRVDTVVRTLLSDEPYYGPCHVL